MQVSEGNNTCLPCCIASINFTTGAEALRGSFFGQGSGPIFLDELACRGDEENLLDCNSLNPRGIHMCDHTKDASVRCIGEWYSNC